MRLKKTVINDQVVYVEVDEEDVKIEDTQKQIENDNSSNNEETKSENDSCNTDDDYIDAEPIDEEENFFKRVGRAANKFAKGVGNTINKTTAFVKESIKTGKEEYDKNQTSKDRNKKLAKILPYLDKESIHELVNKILSNDETTKDLDLEVILPYLTEEDAGLILIRALKDGNTNVKVGKVIKYVDNETKRKIVDMYINEEIDANIYFEDLLPYLDNESIKKIFDYEIFKKDKKNKK